MSIPTLYNYCVRHFDSVDPTEFANLHFAQHGISKWLCSRELPRPIRANPARPPVFNAPLIFEITGTISITEKVSTSRTDDGTPTKIVFWIEPRPNPASKALWRRIPQTVEGIATATSLNHSTENLFKIDNMRFSGALKVRCVWRSHVRFFFLLHIITSTHVLYRLKKMELLASRPFTSTDIWGTYALSEDLFTQFKCYLI